MASLTGCAAETESAASNRSQEINDVDLSSARQMKLVAEVKTKGYHLRFLSGSLEGEDPEIGVLSATQLEEDDIVPALLNDGATALEVFRRFAEDEEAPQVLIDDHKLAAERAGREPEVRDYAELPTINGSVSAGNEICRDYDSFKNYVSWNSTNVDFDSGLKKHNANIQPTSSGGRNVNVFMCNYASNRLDRKTGLVYAASNGGAGLVFEDFVYDGQLLYFYWPNHSAGSTYGITANFPCGLVGSPGEFVCDEAINVRSYLAVGLAR